MTNVWKRTTWYERRLALLILLSAIPNMLGVLAFLITHYLPEFRCDLSDVAGSRGDDISALANNSSFFEFMIPVETSATGELKPSSCFRFDRSYDDFEEYISTGKNLSSYNNSKVSCSKYKFYFEAGESSAAAEFGMVCQDEWKQSVTVFSFMFGMSFGNVIGGVISDRFGRKPAFLGFQFLFAILLFIFGFVNQYETYVVCIAVYSAASLINCYTASILGCEMTSKENRNLMTGCVLVSTGIGYVTFPLLNYWVRDWRWFMWISGLTGVAYVPYFWLLDESPRWLFSQGRGSEAKMVLEKIAAYNGAAAADVKTISRLRDDLEADQERPSWTRQAAMLMRQPVLMMRLAIMGFAWCTVNMGYYGLSFTTNNLEGSRFLNCLYSGLSELGGYVVSFFILEKFGRRNTYTVALTGAGLFIGAAPFLALVHDQLVVAANNVGKFLVGLGFYIVYLMTPELFPTSVRHTACAVDSGFSRIGGMITAFIIYQDQRITAPIIGFMCVASAVLMSLLPKTFNRPFPETIQQALAQKSKSLLVRGCRSERGGRSVEGRRIGVEDISPPIRKEERARNTHDVKL